MVLTAKHIAVYIVLVNEAVAFTSLFPYVGLLVVSFHPSMDRNDAGIYSGLVVSSYQIFQIFASRWWGAYSDRHGRRTPVLWGILFGTIANFVFAFANSLPLALISRSIMGILNGNNVICKSMIGDLATKENEAKLFSYMNFAWSVGGFLGPALGGVLYDPAQRWPHLLAGTVFESRPQLLPCLVVGIWNLLTMIFVWCKLPETNTRVAEMQERKQQQQQQLSKNKRKSILPSSPSTVDDDQAGANATATSTAVVDDEQDDDEEFDNSPIEMAEVVPGEEKDKDKKEQATTPQLSENAEQQEQQEEQHKSFGYCDVFQRPILVRCICMYMLTCAIQIVFVKCQPLLALIPVEDGGYAWDPDMIGLFFAITALFALAGNLLTSYLVDRLGRLPLARWSFFFWAVALLGFPAISPLKQPFPFVVVLALLILVRVFAAGFLFALSTMFTMAQTPREQIGSVSGISHSSGNIVRALFPLVATPLFAWSVQTGTHRSFPFNSYFVFIIAAIMSMAGLLLIAPLQPEDVLRKDAAVAAAATTDSERPEDKNEENEATDQKANVDDEEEDHVSPVLVPRSTAMVDDDGDDEED